MNWNLSCSFLLMSCWIYFEFFCDICNFDFCLFTLFTLSSRSIIGSASMIHLKWVSAYPSFRSIKVGSKFQRIVSPMFIYWTFKTIYTTGFNYFIWWWVPMVHDSLWKTVFPPICYTVFFCLIYNLGPF